MKRTIRKRVMEMLDERIRLDYIWLHIRDEFPHKNASWNYMKRLEREWIRQAMPSQPHK